MFTTFDRQNLTLKNGGKWRFSYETKALIHLSQWGKWAYGAQLWKEKRLLHESMFIKIDRWTLILEMVGREVFLMKPKHQCHLS